MENPMVKHTCPKCGKDDMISKLSLIVSEGTPRSKSELARSLELPPKKPMPLATADCLMSILFLGAVLGFPMVFLMYMTVFRESRSYTIITLGSMIFAIVLWISIFWFYISYRKKQRRITTEYNNQVEKAKDIWERSYLCKRDDIVFDPVNGGYTPRESFQKWVLHF